MIDEFTDVNAGEKEFMKLWNGFAMENKCVHNNSGWAEMNDAIATTKSAALNQKRTVSDTGSSLVNNENSFTLYS